MSQRIYVVEFRQYLDGAVDSTVATLRSSREGAVEWCRGKTDYDVHTTAEPWWFTVCVDLLDDDTMIDNELLSIDWDGNLLGDRLQPEYVRAAEDAYRKRLEVTK